MKVDILDIGSGNISSVKNWIETANVPVGVVSKATDVNSELLILPGVGSAGSYMKRLKEGDFDQAILEHLNKGRRLLGICLGFQIMASYTEEDGGVEGLNLIDAKVERLQNNTSHNEWERFYLRKDDMNKQSFNNKRSLSKKRILDGRVFYNHEYGLVNRDASVFSVPISPKLQKYSGLLVKDNLIGIQFHPEKSQVTGSSLISMVL